MISRRRLLTSALAAPAILRASDALSCNCAGGTGPDTNSSFLKADFTSVYHYPTAGSTTQNPSAGQMQISPRLYGSVDGAFANNGGQIGSFGDTTNGNPFCLLTSPTYQQRMAIVNPGVWMEVSPPNGSGATIWNEPYPAPPAVPTLNPNAFTNLINNFYKLDPLGVSSIILNINWQREVNNVPNQAQYGAMMHTLAVFFQNQVMPNGCRCPVIGFTGQNEPSAGQDIAGYYNQIVSNVKNVTLPSGGTYMVSGPVPDSVFLGTGNWATFSQSVPGMDVFQWDNFPPANSSNAFPMSYLQTPQSQGGISDWYSNGLLTQVSNNVSYQPQAYAPVGNLGTTGNYSEQADYHSAMWDAIQRILTANASPVQAWWMKWDSALQANWGYLLNPGPAGANQISPAGYANGKLISTITGPRWNVPTNSANLLTMAVTPANGSFGLMIVNAGQGPQASKQVALAHWPVNSTGTATANVWQMTNAATGSGGAADQGTTSTVAVTAGLTAAMNFPDPSITIIYI